MLYLSQHPDVYKFMRLLVFLIFISSWSAAQDQYKDIYRESAWRDRDKWQKPGELIKLLNINEGSHVADIGCHEGYMTVKLSKIVSSTGKVYAVDVEQNKLERLKNHLEDRKIRNVKVVKGDYDNPKLPENALDAVVILDSYHEMDDHDEILQHIKTALKPGGRLLLCEPIAESRRKFTRELQEGRHELSMNFALEDLKKAGFKIEFQKDPFIDRTNEKGDYMWVILASK
jgi:ubiquinone/menaquinone biosynthesis C-methylase UbiE